MIPIGENVKRLRTAAGLTQQQLAMAAGLSVSVVSQIEQGTNEDPRLSTLVALAKALGASLDALAKEAAGDGEAPGQAETSKGKAPGETPPPQRKPAGRKTPKPRGG